VVGKFEFSTLVTEEVGCQSGKGDSIEHLLLFQEQHLREGSFAKAPLWSLGSYQTEEKNVFRL
jgi:hypothetical protein